LTAAARPFRLAGATVTVHFLTPSENGCFQYRAAVERAARAIFDDGPALHAANDLPQVEHNHASGGILIEYGATKALLMADAEMPLWNACLGGNFPGALCAPLNFLKVSHHGSVNGYHQSLYATTADPSVTLGVITPFRNGSVSLPTADGVQAIRPHVRELYCTNCEEAAAATGLEWELATHASTPTLPLRWVHMIEQNPALGSLLVTPPRDLPIPRSASATVPLRWIEDARNNPVLFRLIHPNHRRTIPSAARIQDHVISAFFDDQGIQRSLQAGIGVGRLVS
jgi:hypothetical protein